MKLFIIISCIALSNCPQPCRTMTAAVDVPQDVYKAGRWRADKGHQLEADEAGAKHTCFVCERSMGLWNTIMHEEVLLRFQICKLA